MNNRFSFFHPKGEPKRVPRVAMREPLSDKVKATYDEATVMMAEQLLDNFAFDRVFDKLRSKALADITNSQLGMNGMPQRETAHMRIRALDDIRTEIQAIADERKFYKKPVEDQ